MGGFTAPVINVSAQDLAGGGPAQVAQIIAQTNLANQQANTLIPAQANLMGAQAGLAGSQSGLVQAQTAQQQIATQNAQIDLQSRMASMVAARQTFQEMMQQNNQPVTNPGQAAPTQQGVQTQQLPNNQPGETPLGPNQGLTNQLTPQEQDTIDEQNVTNPQTFQPGPPSAQGPATQQPTTAQPTSKAPAGVDIADPTQLEQHLATAAFIGSNGVPNTLSNAYQQRQMQLSIANGADPLIANKNYVDAMQARLAMAKTSADTFAATQSGALSAAGAQGKMLDQQNNMAYEITKRVDTGDLSGANNLAMTVLHTSILNPQTGQLDPQAFQQIQAMGYSSPNNRADTAITQKMQEIQIAGQNAGTNAYNATTNATNAATAQGRLSVDQVSAAKPWIDMGSQNVQALVQTNAAMEQLHNVQDAVDKGIVNYNPTQRAWVVKADAATPGFMKAYGSYVAPDGAFQMDAALKQATAAATDAYVSGNPNVKAGSDSRFGNVMHAINGGTDFSSNPKALSQTLGQAQSFLNTLITARQATLDEVNNQLAKLPGVPAMQVPGSTTPPVIGEIRKGYVYRGGDYTQPSAWSK